MTNPFAGNKKVLILHTKSYQTGAFYVMGSDSTVPVIES